MRLLRCLALFCAFTLGVAACGDDDDDGGGGTAGGGGDTTEAAAGDDVLAFCGAVQEAEQAIGGALEGEGDSEDDGTTTTVANRTQETTPTTAPAGGGEVPPEVEDALTQTEELAPDEVQEDVDAVTTIIREIFVSGDDSAFESDEYAQPEERVDQFMVAECADGTTDVTGVDYAFQGFETELPAGQIGFNFSNEGEELHELALLRVNDDVDLPIQEILDLPEEEAFTMVTEVPGGAFAFPGASDTELIELEPGRYGMVCFIPVGTTPDAPDGGSGPPHFVEGMFGEFTIN